MIILIVEDDRGLAELIKEKVVESGYETVGVYSAKDAQEWLSENKPYMMLLDYSLPDMYAREFLTLLQKKEQPLAAFIVSTGQGDERIAVEMMKLGARDYIIKDNLFLERLPEVIKRVARELENENKRKQAEAEKEELEAQNRQLQKSESLGRMAGAIAHHFNNQLGVVIGNLEMALMEVKKGMQPKAHINAAMKASCKAADMSGLMLTYLGQSIDKRVRQDLSETCRNDLPLLQAFIPGSVLLDTDLPSPGPTVKANTNQMRQVLTNLVTNAREALGEGGGAISLNVRQMSPVEIDSKNRFPVDWQSQDNAYACLEVTDTGCGIEDENIEKVFDPFFSTKFTGRGMGLAVVLGIVKAHKGVITVESEQELGSIFRVFLPVSCEEVPQPTQKAGEFAEAAISASSPIKFKDAGTVLLVEDEELVRELAATMLESLGYSVLIAKDGIEALEVFVQRKAEIIFVLCDLTMPRMSGWATLTALRKLCPGIPVILASGYDKVHVMEGYHPELPQAFLAKPYNLKALTDAIAIAVGDRL